MYKKSNSLLSEIIINYKTVIGFGGRNVEGLMNKYKEMVRLPNKNAVRKAHISGILFGYGQYTKFAIIGVIFWIASLFVHYLKLKPSDVYVAVYCMFLGALGTGTAFSQIPDVGKAR